ncbi:MAG: hypothetical protein GF333_03905 [Candidatus Omnitrophica bacterium]|nr:hypothetical protein [Candidatus Omnitrophota bacterium]
MKSICVLYEKLYALIRDQHQAVRSEEYELLAELTQRKKTLVHELVEGEERLPRGERAAAEADLSSWKGKIAQAEEEFKSCIKQAGAEVERQLREIRQVRKTRKNVSSVYDEKKRKPNINTQW